MQSNRKGRRRLCSIVLTAAMVFAALPMTAFTANAETALNMMTAAMKKIQLQPAAILKSWSVVMSMTKTVMKRLYLMEVRLWRHRQSCFKCVPKP